MARTTKTGLEYFPLDSNFYNNRKIRRLLHSQGVTSLAVWTVVMCKIYEKDGYYLKYDEDTCFDISDSIMGVSEGAVDEIIKVALKVKLFDEELFQKYHILTSESIQKQYIEIASRSRRKYEIDKKYALIPLECTQNDI